MEHQERILCDPLICRNKNNLNRVDNLEGNIFIIMALNIHSFYIGSIEIQRLFRQALNPIYCQDFNIISKTGKLQ